MNPNIISSLRNRCKLTKRYYSNPTEENSTYPNWMNPNIISSLRNRCKLTKRYYSNPTEENKNLLTTKSNECSNMIIEAKERYRNKLSKKSDDPSTMPKAYWSILNTFLNNKKIPNIPPLNVNSKIISNFEKKAELFNSHFAS